MDNLEKQIATGGKKEQLKPLDAVPVFRSNQLYRDLFPEVLPAFQQGEKVTLSKALEFIVAHPGRKVILDGTISSEIRSSPLFDPLTLADFPVGLEFKEVPKNSQEIYQRLQEKFGITIQEESIDGVIQETLLGKASFEEIADSFFEIVKKKNEHIKKLYLVTDKIADHVAGRKGDTEGVISEIETAARKHYGDSLEIVPISAAEINERISSLKEGEHVVLDRHAQNNYSELNPLASSILPFETELYRGGVLAGVGETLTTKLRKKFES